MHTEKHTCNYITQALPYEPEFAGIASLLRHVNVTLRSVWPVRVVTISLKEYITSSEPRPDLFITYFEQDSQEIENDNARKDQYDQDDEWCPDDYASDIIETDLAGALMVDFRMPKGRNQDDVPALFDKVADYLEAKDIKNVRSFMYDTDVDDDAVDRPVIRIVVEK